MGCESEHEYYIKGTQQLVGEVVSAMRACLHGDKSFFPKKEGETNSGISRMPSKIMIYKTEWIVLDVDRDQGEGDMGMDTTYRSIDKFTDPLVEIEYEEEVELEDD
jgi:hypothetical protein